MKNLYLIGNGFDLHHGIPSSYRDYHDWLTTQSTDIPDKLDRIYGADNIWWSDFENNLGIPNIELYIDSIRDTYPKFMSDNYRDRDRYIMPDTATSELSELYSDVRQSFSEWITYLPLGEHDTKIRINDVDSFFITLNYTCTLQRLYCISKDLILHIHGNMNKPSNLILGHGKTYEEISAQVIPNLPTDSTDPDDIEKYLGENHDPIIDETETNVVDQVTEQRKDVEEIMANNANILNQLTDVTNIYIYGFSFSPIDIPYLNKIISKIDISKTKWEISYFSTDDKNKINHYMSQKRIQSNLYSLVKLEDLQLLKQLKLSL